MHNKNTYNLSHKKVWIAGHNGMVGKAIKRRLQVEKCEVLTVNKKEVDLRNQSSTESWLKLNKPDVIFIAAAKVGGIKANMLQKYSFLYDNLMIQNNIINSAKHLSLDKLVFLGSSCIYPKEAPQPIKEESLLDGKLEMTNEGYALSKINVMKACEYIDRDHNEFLYKTIIPCNLCGSQEGLKRQVVKEMLQSWDKQHPGRIETIFSAIKNVAPSQLADSKLYNFVDLISAHNGAVAKESSQNLAINVCDP